MVKFALYKGNIYEVIDIDFNERGISVSLISDTNQEIILFDPPINELEIWDV